MRWNLCKSNSLCLPFLPGISCNFYFAFSPVLFHPSPLSPFSLTPVLSPVSLQSSIFRFVLCFDYYSLPMRYTASGTLSSTRVRERSCRVTRNLFGSANAWHATKANNEKWKSRGLSSKEQKTGNRRLRRIERPMTKLEGTKRRESWKRELHL